MFWDFGQPKTFVSRQKFFVSRKSFLYPEKKVLYPEKIFHRKKRHPYSSIVLTIQLQLFVSELFKDIQDENLMIFIAGQCCYSEQLLPVYLPHWMCVGSIFILSSILDLNLEVNIRARDRQYSSCFL